MAVTRVFDLLDNYITSYGDKPDAFAGKDNGQWYKWSMTDFIRRANDLAAGLINAGLNRGDRVAILSINRPEWNLVDFATQIAGGILVPVFPTISDNDLEFILTNCEAKFVFVWGKPLYEKTVAVCAKLPNAPTIVCVHNQEDALLLSGLEKQGKENPRNEIIEAVKRETKAEDLLTILYTSGTTGTPKGVMLSHHNLVSNFTSLRDLPPVDHTCRCLSFLPLNHIYERMLTYLYLFKGPSIYYAESLETIGDNIREVQPQMFSCVPHLVQKVYNRIVGKGDELKGIKRSLFFWALELAETYDKRPGVNSWWYNFRLSIASKIIFNKWREALGGNVRAMVSGGAALDQRLARIFWAAGIPVLEGYGLTETSPVIAVNNFANNGVHFGTVGPLIQDVQVKFAEDGEILVKGPNVMMGYYKNPEATAEVLDSDGWFHTGDIGKLVENRFLKITDRKKEIFKTAGGKYIAPQMIENLLKSSRFVEQSMIVGENEKFASALIVPSFAFVKEWAKRKGLSVGETPEEIINNPKVKARIEEAVNKINAALAQYEKVKKIALLSREWTVVSGELTPKLSLKRKVIMKSCEQQVSGMYKGD
jgi:long-chain acyl-CoA synthetase